MPAPSSAFDVTRTAASSPNARLPVDEDTHERVLLRIVHFLLDAKNPQVVARRAATSLGLLPEVAWAEVVETPSDRTPDLRVSLSPAHVLEVHLRAGVSTTARARVEGILRLIMSVHQREQTVERLTNEAHTDPLTGLYNRRGFEPFVDQALARAARNGEDVSLLVCDIDHFKSINDTWGHDVGDQALAVVAKAIREVIRPTDLAARLGGDEIAILLSGSDANGATCVAQRLAQAVDRANPLTGVPLTLSMGIADAAGLAGTEPGGREALVRAADEALYLAKRNGRARFACHPSCFAPREALDSVETEPIEVGAA